jgi:hypothetical protein
MTVASKKDINAMAVALALVIVGGFFSIPLPLKLLLWMAPLAARGLWSVVV